MIVDTPAGSFGIEQAGEGQDLLLLHSLLTDRRVYDRILPKLSQHKRITLIDLPGYGESDRVDPDIGSYGAAVAALADAVDLGSELAIVGNGLGAFVALELAAQSPARVGRLVLAGVAAHFPQPAKEVFDGMAVAAMSDGMESVTDTALGRIFTTQYGADHPDMVEERRQALLRMDREGFVAGCQVIRSLEFTTTALSGIGLPVLVVVGSDDQATPPAFGKAVAEALPAGQYMELPGVAHAPQLQAPDQFIAAIGPFLRIS